MSRASREVSIEGENSERRIIRVGSGLSGFSRGTVTEKAVQASWRYDPEQEQFVIRTRHAIVDIQVVGVP